MSQATGRSADDQIIRKIARRALDSISGLRAAGVLSIDIQAELAACHRTSPLRLQALLQADELSFATEILAIRRHLDRATGQLGGSFLPRFHQRQAPPRRAAAA